MSEHGIPANVQKEASREGFNRVKFLGSLDGIDYYSVGCVDSNGTPVPMGLPTFIQDDGGRLSIISGLDGLDLSSRLH